MGFNKFYSLVDTSLIMGSAKNAAVKVYIRLPKSMRRFTDPHVRGRAKYVATIENRSEKGKQLLKGGLRKVLGGKGKVRKRK